MKLNLFFSTVCAASLGSALLASPAMAADAQPGFYAGGGLSVPRNAGLGGKVDAALASQGIGSTTGASSDDLGLGTNLRLGYRINPNLAVEATWDRAARMNLQSAIATPGADTATGSWRAQGLGLHALGIAPVNDRLSVYGRFGVEQWRTRLNLASSAGGATAVSTTSSNTGFALGAGASYALTPQVDATAELVHHTRVGDAATTGRNSITAVNFGVLYHFL